MMTQSLNSPDEIARQLLAIETLLGCEDFIPARDNPLPELAPAPSSHSANETTTHAAETVGYPDDMTPEQKATALRDMDEQEIKSCTRCVLSNTRTNTVFGETNPDADLVFVGEGPGADEDAQGRPFVGRAGELLNKMIAAMGLQREDVFICNMVKCRPPNNRTPAPEEVQACWGYLVRQLQILRPKVIVTLGNPATKGLLNTKTGITRLRGTWQRLPNLGDGLEGIPVMPTFHPAYVLRQYTPENRKKVWSDLQAVMQLLQLPLPTSN